MSAHLQRLVRIYNRLSRGPVTIEILSKWAESAGLSVSDRQLYRDLQQLASLVIAEARVIEYSDEKNRKTWKLECNESSENITQYDINSFFLLKNFAPYAVLEQRKSSIEKFEKILYKQLSRNKYQQYIQAYELYLRRTNYMENMYTEIEHQQIEDLIWAAHNNRIIVIDSDLLNVANNHLPEDAFPLTVYPMELVFHRGRVHIGGFAPKYQKVVIYALDKDLKFHLTNESFSRKKITKVYTEKTKPLFGISDFKDKVFHVKLEFTRGFAESFKSFFWHESEEWTLMKNGNYMLHLRCGIGRELVGFIALGLDKIKIHQPKKLRDLMIEKYQQSALVNEKNLPINEETANSSY